VNALGVEFFEVRLLFGAQSYSQMLGDFVAFFRVISPRVPADVIPTSVDIFDRVMVLSDAYIVRALPWISVVSPQCLTLYFRG
jgi:hypothetical protein